MKRLKKGLSLCAAAAFLIAALVPIGALAAQPASLPVLTSAPAVQVAGTAFSTTQELATAPTAYIMPGQTLQLQVTGSVPSTVTSGTQGGWRSAENLANAANATPDVTQVPVPSPGATVPALSIIGTPSPSPAPTPAPTASPSSEPTAPPTESPSQEPSGSPSPSPSENASESPSPSPSESASEGASGDNTGSRAARAATDATVEAGTSRSYAYVLDNAAASAPTRWGAGFNVSCIQPGLQWSGLTTVPVPGTAASSISSLRAGEIAQGTVTWTGAVPPAAAGSTQSNPAVSASVTDSDNAATSSIAVSTENQNNGTRFQLQPAANAKGGIYHLQFRPVATSPAQIADVTATADVQVLGYSLQNERTVGSVGQVATSTVRWAPQDLQNWSAGSPSNAASLTYVWEALETPAPVFSNGVYDASTGTITAQTSGVLTDNQRGPYQYRVQAYNGTVSPQNAVGQPVTVELGNVSNYTLTPIASESRSSVVSVGSKGTSSVMWAAGGAAQTPSNPSSLTYEWVATGTNAASAPRLTAIAVPVTGAIATAESESAMTPEQVGTYTYTVQAYSMADGTKTPVGNAASVTMQVVMPELEGDPQIIRATIQSVVNKVLRVKWSDTAAPNDPTWLANLTYTWTPLGENISNWPVVDITTTQPSNALRSNFEGGSPNVYQWRVQAVYTDPATGRQTNIGSPTTLQLDLYSDNTLVAAYPSGTAFIVRVGETGAMSVEWADGFTKNGETYTWSAPEGAPAIQPPTTAMSATTVAATLAQAGQTYTYTVQAYTPQGAVDGNAAKVDLYVQPYNLKPVDAAPTALIGQAVELEAAWSSENGAAVPAEDAQITYTWSGPVPSSGPAVTGNGLKATVAAPTEEGEWTYTLTAQTGTGDSAVTIATAEFKVTAVSPVPPEEPALRPIENDVSISTVEDVKYIVGQGLSVTASGHTVDEVISMMHAPVEGYQIQITGPDGSTVKAENAIVGTGDQMKLIQTSDGSTVEYAIIVVRGDVTGTGTMSLTQLVQMASAYRGTIDLDGAKRLAADLDGSGGLNLTDLVIEARYYREEIMHSSGEESPSPEPTTAPLSESSAEPSAESSEAPASGTPAASESASASASAS